MEEKTFMTPEGLQKLKDKLEYLKTVKRPDLSKKLADARSFGDLSENAEYDIARDEQRANEDEIFMIENQIKTAVLIDPKKISTNKVNVGCKVTVTNVKMNKNFEYTIVGDTDADPLKGKISNNSPIGSGLIGKKVGDVVKIKTPAGLNEYKIVKIKL